MPAQLENQADKGVVRPAAQSARTRPRRARSVFLLRWGTSGPLLSFFFPGRRSGVSRLREPRAAPQRSRPARAHRHGPRRPRPKVCALAQRDRARAIRTGRMGWDIAGESRTAGCSLRSAVTPPRGVAGAIAFIISNSQISDFMIENDRPKNVHKGAGDA